MAKGNGMTGKAASRIQSGGANRGGGKVPKGSFASRAQRAAAKNKSRNPVSGNHTLKRCR